MKNEKDCRLKIYLFYGMMFLMVLFCIELLAQLSFFIIFGKRYSNRNLKNYVVHKYDTTDWRADFYKQEIIHPYVGYVFDYEDEKKNFTSQGFYTNISPVVKKDKGKLNVVVLGGSVAKGLAHYIEKAWEKTFKIKPRLINLACPGYKQPQQLMALAYFLSLGAEYDLVINLDGFNDIVLPYTENYRAGINPFFPRSWELRINDNPAPKLLAAIGKVRYLRDIKQKRLAELSTSIFNVSATYGLIKMLQLIINNKEIYDSSTALYTIKRKLSKRFVETGPVEHYKNIKEMHAAAAEFWYRCSLLINSLAKDRGFEYYHFLQPDQYLQGSKQLTPEEKRIAFNKKHLYRQSVVIGYPMLIDKGKALLKNRVNFFDATMVFANIDETVYCDDCCHFNRRGNQIVADYIIQEISRHSKLEKLKPAGTLSN
jgi:hypothetical protein